MPKFRVILREVTDSEVIVDADSAESAEAAAKAVFLQDGPAKFFASVESREAIEVTEVEG
jgi:hypothetical protein